MLKLETETVSRRCTVRKVFLKTSQNSQEKTCVGVSFLIKLQVSDQQILKKETLVLKIEFPTINVLGS